MKKTPHQIKKQKLASFFKDNSEISESYDKILDPKIAKLTKKKPELFEILKTHYRLYAIHLDRTVAISLVGSGYTSAHSISRTARKKFMDSVKNEIDERLAGEIHQKAKSISQTVTQMVMSIKSVMSNSYTGLHTNNMPPSLQEYLKTIPGYKDFFGDQDYCDCDEFASIFYKLNGSLNFWAHTSFWKLFFF